MQLRLSGYDHEERRCFRRHTPLRRDTGCSLHDIASCHPPKKGGALKRTAGSNLRRGGKLSGLEDE